MKVPSQEELDRVAFVISRFVARWSLPLNPENLNLIAFCILKHGLAPDSTYERLAILVDNEIRADAAEHRRMLDAMASSRTENELS